MSVVIFVGPTLYGEDPSTVLGASYRGPAAQGDVLRAVLEEQTRVIGIIDGFFERVPSVWHKEILWAMAQGVHVFGAGSIGALRAAELAPFGMEGVGKVYQAFADGHLEDDDEVAVIHAPREYHYRPASEAMVDVRATISAAEAAGIVSSQSHWTLVHAAKLLFYPDRMYPRILADALNHGADPSDIRALEAYLPYGRVGQKHADAIQMLATIKCRLDQGLDPKCVDYSFQCSQHFYRALSDAGALDRSRSVGA
jgi:hypothetical protein